MEIWNQSDAERIAAAQERLARLRPVHDFVMATSQGLARD